MSLLNRSLSRICLKGLIGGFLLLSSPFLNSSLVLAQSEEIPALRAAITNEADRIFVNTLVKSTLVALNQANLTENYSVLQALSSNAFKANNSEEELAEIFKAIREYGLDFAAIVEYPAVFTVEPTLDTQNNLRVVGYFETSPLVEFDLVFNLVDGRFLIDGLTVAIRPVSNETGS
ncbi:hypothetical protein Lepto7376_3041 [[Leptolyngbya] sp. PCC 7376]|nr:hypothetical protein Lepto7376_3041 [[Leptolyngbya] sp. PCC 7376]